MQLNNHQRRVLRLLHDMGPMLGRQVFSALKRDKPYSAEPRQVVAEWTRELFRAGLLEIRDGKIQITQKGSTVARTRKERQSGARSPPRRRVPPLTRPARAEDDFDVFED